MKLNGCKKYLGYFLGLSILLVPNYAKADFISGQCSSNGYTVATINGIFTDKKGAEDNMIALFDKLGLSWNAQEIDYQYLHNESHLGGIGDLIKSIEQKLFDSWTVTDYDLVEMLKDSSAKVKTQKLLVVGYSQGNFYSNSFYDKVAGKSGGVPKESIGVYSVATPAGRVAGNGKYITSDTDKVIAGWVSSLTLGSIMKPNTHIDFIDGSNGHSFSDIYLKYRGGEIVSDIGSSLDKLTANSIQDEQKPCIDKPDLGLIGNTRQYTKGAVLFVLDPVAGKIVENVRNAGDAVLTTGKFAYDATLTTARVIGGVVLNVFANKSESPQPVDLVAQVLPIERGESSTPTSLSGDGIGTSVISPVLVPDSPWPPAKDELRKQNELAVESANPPNILNQVPAAPSEIEIREAKMAEIQARINEIKIHLDDLAIREASEAQSAAALISAPPVSANQVSYASYSGGGGGGSSIASYGGNNVESLVVVAENEQSGEPEDTGDADQGAVGVGSENDTSNEDPVSAPEEEPQSDEPVVEDPAEEVAFEEAAEAVEEVVAANHLVISELQVGGQNSGDEFIEIYNPTSEDFSLDGWSFQYVSGSAVSFPDVSVTVKQFDAQNIVKSKGFFLVARGLNNAGGDYQGRLDYCRDDAACISDSTTDGYLGIANPDLFHRTFKLSGTTNGGNIFLVKNTEEIISLDDENIVDVVSYGEPALTGVSKAVLPDDNQSIERKAVLDDLCVSPHSDGELLGNGCDTEDNASDFELNVLPNPQNSLGSIEPVPAPSTPIASPEVADFSIAYDRDKLELVFSWTSFVNPRDTSTPVTHKILDSDGATIFETTTESSYRERIYEIGRDYDFSIKAFDADGVELASSIKSISVPSFVRDTHFYSAEYRYLGAEKTTGPLIEFSYDDYPFAPRDLVINGGGDGTGNNYKVAVFYLNKDAPSDPVANEFLFNTSPLDSDMGSVLRVEYETCAGSSSFHVSLLLPDVPENCGINGGIQNGAMNWRVHLTDLDKHLLLPVQSPDGQTTFSQADYFTVAYYGFYRIYPWGTSVENGGADTFKLLAVDKTHYVFDGGAVTHQKPNPPTNLQFSLNEEKAILTVSWGPATDPDSIDAYLRYEISYDFGETWKEVGYDELIVEAGNIYSVQVRAIDDLGLRSDVLTGSFDVPEMPHPKFGISNLRWGNVDGSPVVSFDYPAYPFITDEASSYNAMVFYLNRLPPLTYAFNAVQESSYSQVGIAYSSCDGYLRDYQRLILTRGELLSCAAAGSGLHRQALYPTPDLVGGNISLPIRMLYNADKSVADLTSGDYFTIGFYRIDGIGVWNPGNVSSIANDTHRYFFAP